MNAKKTGNIDQYIAQFPEATQKQLRRLRAVIRAAAPQATEAISYGMPAFYIHGKYLVYFGGYKKHIGFYPIPRGVPELDKLYSSYNTSGKGTIQFPLNAPLPTRLIEKIVRYRAAKNLQETKVTAIKSAKRARR